MDHHFYVKISDFGLSKDVYSREYYRPSDKFGTPLPVKWMALECLQDDRVFLKASDVVGFILISNSTFELFDLLGFCHLL